MDWVKIIHNRQLDLLISKGLKGLSKYFRLKVDNIEALPEDGRAMVISNHSGFAGLDALILAHVIKNRRGKPPRILAHRLYFELFDFLKALAESFGLKQATYEGGRDILNEEDSLLVFPEAESGNFKPTMNRYELQTFHTGFIRMALSTKTPIVPAYVIGAEESHINLAEINFGKVFGGLKVPLPLNMAPLPSKWRICFLEPIHLHETYSQEIVSQRDELKKIAEKFRQDLQVKINEDLKKRKFIFLGNND